METLNFLHNDLTNYLQEELNDYQKKLVSKWNRKPKNADESAFEPKSVHDDFFAHYNNGDKKATKVIIPFDPVRSPIPHYQISRISDILHARGGWSIHDYHEGIATRRRDTRFGPKPEFKRIGAILSDAGEESALDVFNSDPHRAAHKGKMQIVISRDPHDVASMSTGRGWESCMTLPEYKDDENGGCNHHYIEQDLKHKTMVAYLTKEGDDNIEKPIARIAIKKFLSGKKGKDVHKIWRPEHSVYGAESGGFTNKVNQLMVTHYPAKPRRTYEKEPSLYNDTGDEYEGRDDKLPMNVHRFTSNYPVEKIVSQTLNSDNQLHSVDDKPSLIIHTSTGGQYHHNEIHFWHKNGELHHETNPSMLVYGVKKNGQKDLLQSVRHIHGNLHDGKNGEPAMLTHEYDDEGNMTMHRAEFKRYGMTHNGILSGVGRVTVRHIPNVKSSIEAQKIRFGSENSDDDGPSSFKRVVDKDGNTISESKKWARNHRTQVEESSEYKDGKLNTYEKENFLHGTSHNWHDGNGVISSSLGHGYYSTFKHVSYKDDKPNDDPDESIIHSIEYKDRYETPALGPNGEASLLSHKGYSFRNSDDNKVKFGKYPTTMISHTKDIMKLSPDEIKSHIKDGHVHEIEGAPVAGEGIKKNSTMEVYRKPYGTRINILDKYGNIYESHSYHPKENTPHNTTYDVGHYDEVEVDNKDYNSNDEYKQKIDKKLKENNITHNGGRNLDELLNQINAPSYNDVSKKRIK